MIPETTKILLSKTNEHGVSEKVVGGKGWNLFRLAATGFLVPRWSVIPSNLFAEVLLANHDTISSLLMHADYSSQDSLVSVSRQINQIMQSPEVLSMLADSIEDAIRVEFGNCMHVSVRSSVIGEDSVEHSFAGLMDSFLYVPVANITPFIAKVWGSAFSPRSLMYRHRKGISLSEISTAVIIQEMVHAISSGVLFTRNPETREKQSTIAAGCGVGEGIVADIVETDTYTLDWETGEIRKEVTEKGSMMAFNEASFAGTRIEAVPDELRSRPVLTDDQIRQLHDLGLRGEQSFGLPLDIEWAFDERGTLFVLQARPIVFPPQTRSNGSVRIWENSNIVESYPGITLPLTFSFVREGYELSFYNATRGFFPFKRMPEQVAPFFRNMIGLLDGRIYYNLLNWYQMLSYLPGFRQHKKSWDQMIGISRDLDFPVSRLSFFVRFFSFLRAATKLVAIRGNAKRFSRRFRTFYRRFGKIDLTSASEQELVRIYDEMKVELNKIWYLTLYNDFAAMKYYDWLKKLSSRFAAAVDPNLHNNLLCGEKGVESVEPVRSLLRIAEIIRRDSGFTSLLNCGDNPDIWMQIQGNPAYERLKIALEQHLEAYGDRGLEELKLERPTFRDDPSSLIGLIKNYCLLHLSVEGMEQQEQSIRKEAERTIRRAIRNPLQRLLFRFILRNARCAIANRENMRFARSKMFGIMRRMFRRFGELFAGNNLLSSAVDIYYMTVEETFGIVQGTAVTQNLRALVDLRKKEYEAFAMRNPGERIETTGIPYLNNLSGTPATLESCKELKGIGCSSGIVEGEARIVLDPKTPNESSGKILVARSTDPGWVFLMISSKGIIVEKGSVLSHTAIIGRELGIPTVVGVANATKLIPDGATVQLDGTRGAIRWV
ncbi:MAG: hypothetical protein HY563_06290 [Ignavibacteriales bacterium]|nr:hypothetical protein [Ignavibacteriales bacterium]